MSPGPPPPSPRDASGGRTRSDRSTGSTRDPSVDLPVSPRALLGWLATLVLGALAGPVLGEYEFHGWFPPVAGVLTPLLLGEVCVAAAKGRSVISGAVTVVASAGGLLLAGWFASSRGLDPYPATAWLAAAIGAVVAWLRAGPWVGRRRAGSTAGTSPSPRR